MRTAIALENIKDEKAVPALKPLLNDKSELVREEAERALREIDRQ